jgi:NAD(P)-dependent dehydrogenase (short-subunit alcohol dehydrogenase family)
MAMEYIKQSIRINAVCPGATDTEMNKNIRFPENVDWGLVKRYMPQREDAQPEDVASAIAYLASDEARTVHGSIFSVDNGMAAG